MTRNIVHILTRTTQLLSFVVKLLTRSILPKFLFSKQGENMNLEIFARQVSLPRATELNLLTHHELVGIPTNNLEPETHLV